jgi:hypothetical protein
MLALLDYPNPLGLHPNECRWRDLARDLKAQLRLLHDAMTAQIPGYRASNLAQATEPFVFDDCEAHGLTPSRAVSADAD